MFFRLVIFACFVFKTCHVNSVIASTVGLCFCWVLSDIFILILSGDNHDGKMYV